MKIKRLLSLMMATVMGLTLFGCGGARAEDSGISPLNANVPAFDDDPEPESLPFFASLFNAKETPAPVAGEIAKAVYPSPSRIRRRTTTPTKAEVLTARPIFRLMRNGAKWSAPVLT